ncbi:hypothetical protein [Bradyrhizobium sp. Ai1a-2]|uniref:phage head spike fiber domain-containing protein n=1 Tax=Bradyrhizobium sp. Ai1a-2 TaxID=196490 RepID=UPI001269802D|nr:hypothetical protein [Bradyrhizobium sp. Ai1a-2]
MRITDLGCLIEESRTNLMLQNQSATAAAWNAQNLNRTDNAAIAPDSTMTASLVARTSTAANCYFQSNIAVTATAGATYTVSRYVKKSTVDGFFGLRIQGTYPVRADAVFNLNNGTIVGTAVTTFSGQSATITPLANGWYFVTLTATLDAGTTAIRVVNGPASGSSVSSWEGSSATLSDAHVWGGNLELGAFATSTIPTTTTSAVRVADQVSVSGALAALLFSTLGYAFAAKLKMPTPLNVGNNNYVLAVSDGTLNNRISNFVVGSSGNGSYRHIVAGAATNPLDRSASFPAGTAHTFGRSVSNVSDTSYVDGIAGAAVGQTAMPTVNQGYLGSNETGNASFFNGYIPRVSFWSNAVNLSGVTVP